MVLVCCVSDKHITLIFIACLQLIKTAYVFKCVVFSSEKVI